MKLKIVRKKFLKENCGDSAMPIGVEAEPVLDPIADLENMSSQDAYNAGYNSAIQEISAMLSDLEFGGIPVDAAIPVGIEAVDQLEEEDDGECPESGCIHKDNSVSGQWEIESNKTGKDWPAKYDSKKKAAAALRGYHASK